MFMRKNILGELKHIRLSKVFANYLVLITKLASKFSFTIQKKNNIVYTRQSTDSFQIKMICGLYRKTNQTQAQLVTRPETISE